MSSSYAPEASRAIESAEAILDALPAHIALLDARGIILRVNDSWHCFGSDHVPSAIRSGVGDPYRLPCHGDAARDLVLARRAAAGIQEVIHGRAPVFTMEFACHTPSTRRWFELTASPMRGGGTLVVHIDITDRHQAQAGVLRLNRLYAVAISINEAIVHLPHEQDLFVQACRIAVEQGGLLMAWVGVADPLTAKLGVAASWGEDRTFLDAVQLSSRAGTHGGDGPAGRAFRSGEPVSCNDIASEPGPFAGRDIALALGYRSCAALPLKVGGSPIGVYVAYSDSPGFFDGEVTRLMTTLASNFSFAVEARRRAASQRADVESLRQSQALLRIASRLGRIGAWTLDLHDFALQWSDEVRDIHGVPHGYTPTMEEALAFYPPEYLTVVKEGMEGCARAGTPFTRELQIQPSSGGRIWVRTTAEAQRNEEGAIVRLQGAFQDISERKRRDAENRDLANRLASTLENISDAFVTIDREWHLSYVNSQAVRLLRKSRSELVGLRIWDVFPAAMGGRFHREYERALAENVTVEFEEYFEPLGMWFEIHAYPSAHGLAVYFRDVSGPRRARDEILRLNEQLEERVRDRTAELEAANRELEAFSYSIAHDLRSPLRSIDGFGHLLERSIPPGTAGRSLHYVTRIRASVKLMSQMTDALLALAQLSRASLKWEAVDLGALATRILDTAREADAHRVAHVFVQAGMQVCGDAGLLAMVMENLIGNAWKFSAKKAVTEISVGAEMTARGEPSWFVKDNGAGFDMAHSGKLFGVFERLHQPSEFAGTGIGLANVSRIIVRHGGRVWARAVPGEGATFYFTLGAPPPAPAA